MNLDFSPLFRSSIGFDRLSRMMDAATQVARAPDSYPPYDIEKLGEDSYRLSMAVAGFKPADLEVVSHRNVLSIKGRIRKESNGQGYLYQGIARRAFERRFQLADAVEVRRAALADGVLTVDLVREIPEEHRPRRIEITAGGASGELEASAEVASSAT